MGLWVCILTPSENNDQCVGEVKEVKCPTLVLHGMKDCLSPAFHAEYLGKEHQKLSVGYMV